MRPRLQSTSSGEPTRAAARAREPPRGGLGASWLTYRPRARGSARAGSVAPRSDVVSRGVVSTSRLAPSPRARVRGDDARALLRGMIPTAAAQSAAIFTLGDALCQRLERSPDGFDLRRSAVNATYGGAFLGPLGHVWYNGLDAAVARVLPGGGARMIAAKLVADLGVFGPAHLAAFLACNAAANATDPRRVPPGDPNPVVSRPRYARRRAHREGLRVLPSWTRRTGPMQTAHVAAVPVRHQLAFMNAACVLDAAFLSWLGSHSGFLSKFWNEHKARKERERERGGGGRLRRRARRGRELGKKRP